MAKPGTLFIIDPINGRQQGFDQFPFVLGGGESSDWRVSGRDVSGKILRVDETPRGYELAAFPGTQVVVDFSPLAEPVVLEESVDYSVTTGENLFLLRVVPVGEPWAETVDLKEWTVFSGETGQVLAGCATDELAGYYAQQKPQPHTLLATPRGVTAGFWLETVVAAWRLALSPASGARGQAGTASEPAPAGLPFISSDDYTCPTCWLGFGAGDVMSIASHDHLRGDPLLGPDAKLRFVPTRFNDKGQAIDSMGLPCLDSACPHCRRKLPPSFLDLPNSIISIVGAPSAGKSYYICTLIKALSSTLYREFRLTFRDGDPSGNAQLNAMKNQLFSARTPDEAFLLKTVLEGIMYERLPRHGRDVALPRPFVYELSPVDTPNESRAVIFYDNAGEHFKPNVSLDDSPGALHVASSSAILFLIDPTTNPQFRARLRDHADPQLGLNAIDEQDTIMAEMGVRIRTVKGLPARQRSAIPLAVILGKCDVWEHLLPGPPLERPVADGVLDLRLIDETSKRIRALLLDMDPSLVAVADSVSEHVVFFPVSSFGHTPVPIASGPHAGKYAPDPALLSPRFVEIPFLWGLSRFAPGLIPTRT